jgi:predicted DNA-binding helix-hairpin-helix protein
MAKLSYRKRKALPKTAFAIPKDKSYPINDEAHAKNALARVSQFGTSAEKKKVRNAVKKKFPKIKQKKK